MAVRELPQFRQMNLWLSGVLEFISMVLLYEMDNASAILDTGGIRKSDTDDNDWYQEVNVAFMVRISPLTYPFWLRSLLVQI